MHSPLVLLSKENLAGSARTRLRGTNTCTRTFFCKNQREQRDKEREHEQSVRKDRAVKREKIVFEIIIGLLNYTRVGHPFEYKDERTVYKLIEPREYVEREDPDKDRERVKRPGRLYPEHRENQDGGEEQRILLLRL